MTAQELATDIKTYCRQNASPEVVVKYSRYFKGGFKGWGLTQLLSDQKKSELIKSGILNADLVFEAAPLLMESEMYEETSFVLGMLDAIKKQLSGTDIERFKALFSIGINNWAHADYLGMYLLPALVKLKVLTYDELFSWIDSPYTFQRRCVPVTCLKRLPDEESYSQLFYRLEPLMTDPDREVHQGMGWFLREAWKKKPSETEAFLIKWKDVSPRLIFQYACEKMTPEHRLTFKRKKFS